MTSFSSAAVLEVPSYPAEPATPVVPDSPTTPVVPDPGTPAQPEEPATVPGPSEPAQPIAPPEPDPAVPPEPAEPQPATNIGTAPVLESPSPDAPAEPEEDGVENAPDAEGAGEGDGADAIDDEPDVTPAPEESAAAFREPSKPFNPGVSPPPPVTTDPQTAPDLEDPLAPPGYPAEPVPAAADLPEWVKADGHPGDGPLTTGHPG